MPHIKFKLIDPIFQPVMSPEISLFEAHSKFRVVFWSDESIDFTSNRTEITQPHLGDLLSASFEHIRANNLSHSP
jgi:hypothetical protein